MIRSPKHTVLKVFKLENKSWHAIIILTYSTKMSETPRIKNIDSSPSEQ